MNHIPAGSDRPVVNQAAADDLQALWSDEKFRRQLLNTNDPAHRQALNLWNTAIGQAYGSGAAFEFKGPAQF